MIECRPQRRASSSMNPKSRRCEHGSYRVRLTPTIGPSFRRVVHPDLGRRRHRIEARIEREFAHGRVFEELGIPRDRYYLMTKGDPVDGDAVHRMLAVVRS